MWGANDVTVRLGGKVALESVSIDIEPGVIHAVIGGDGAGKSTLLRVLAGVGLSQTGERRLPSAERIGFVPADGGLFADLTVDENMAFTAAVYGLTGWQPRAESLLERSAIVQFGDRIAGHLSGGQRRKLAASMALLSDPQLLILDEVTTGVDPLSRLELWRMVAAAAASGTAVVAATTYLDEAERAGRVLLLHDGRVLAAGEPDTLIASLPGGIMVTDIPDDRSTAWRRGRRWHQWMAGVQDDCVSPTLEDAAIVLELAASGRISP